MKKFYFILLFIAMTGCKENNSDTNEETAQDTLAVAEREYKVLDSQFLDKDVTWEPFNEDLERISENRYGVLSPMILDKTIPELQQAIKRGDFTYEEMVLFFLHRIKKLDRNNAKSLNSVIALNPNVVEEARNRDRDLQEGRQEKHPAFGIPVLLKDNINTSDMATTAGAVALTENRTEDAFIVERLRENGALILGKANLSEWAYFFCGDCPSGYSAIGGQTLNPYGRKILDTGGSSSGSAVAVAANFAPAAIGSETSGSILSPSSQNSLVGLKPTIGVLSRGGIVPISSTLDTPGPITKSVIDNAIIFSAMTGKDSKDPASMLNKNNEIDFYSGISGNTLKGKRLGAMKNLMEDSLYVAAVEDLRKAGAEVIIYEPEEVQLPNFIRLLNLDMKKDLPDYLETYGGEVEVRSVEDVMAYNLEDTLARAPYGQALFQGIMADTATPEEFAAIKDTLRRNGRRFFDVPMKEHNLDAILSINNYHAGFAAVAHYPAITVPMGYGENNAPKGLTFFSKPYTEANLYSLAYGYEQASKRRVSPGDYSD
ncbi:amidase [Antarcticibacterium flavum]|uniref:Amidase n=1 Tax=Antarcticibacterium flavum TaxID=2058175 RepID=A0A5B7X6E6_9FLAO|nr:MULTISPECIES: amidase family protein [Antarcticibacterium]MCM4159782.1 amidase [Antarcticibacterium sp. W02-3]QCY70710.1 amidase [Antarcticibacterium flavum]